MAVQHVRDPVYGVQFHPESVLTEHGYRLVDHFLHGVPATPRAVAHRRRRRPGGLRNEADHPGLGSSAGGPRPVIIETIVTTMDPAGAINFAPMGVEWGEETIVLKPFLETTTYRNVTATGVAVINLTDDAMLFAQGADLEPPVSLGAGDGGPRCRPRGRLLLARDRGGVHRFDATAVPDRSPASGTRGRGANSSASIGHGTPSSRRPSWPRARTCFRRSRSGTSSPGSR